MVRSLHALWALSLGACFVGKFLAGQPCRTDSDCGTELLCQDGVCGGASEETSSATQPTTSTSTSTTTTTTTTATTSMSTSMSTTGEPCGIGRCKDIDFLFLYDDSPSMGEKIQTIITALLAFQIEVFPALDDLCSLHLGVVTTDQKYPFNPLECQQTGALVQVNQNGESCPFVEGHPYATLPDLADPTVFNCSFDVGSKGEGDERPIDALFAAVADKRLNEGCNDGFYRPDAFLFLALTSDEDDDDMDAQGHNGSTKGMTDLWDDLFRALKTEGVEDMYVLALLGDEDPNTTQCPWNPASGMDGSGAEAAPNLRNFVSSFPEDHYEIGSFCTEPHVDTFRPMAKKVLEELIATCKP